MRLQLVGAYSLIEFQKAVFKIIAELDSYNIETIQNANIYIRPNTNGSEISFIENGKQIDHLIFDFREKQRSLLISTQTKTTDKGKP